MTEADLGKAMKAHALAEGHKARLPPVGQERSRPHYDALSALIGQGLTHAEIGRAIGVGKSRVTQLLGQYGLRA